MPAADDDDVIIYSSGPLALSVCAPSGMEIDVVRTRVEQQHPCGTTGGWQKVDDRFASGEPNPCPCNTFPTLRRHWVLHA